MQVVVFGASGKVGSLVVRKLLDDGHNVRAFVHSESRFAKNPRLQNIQVDIHDSKAVIKAIDGAQAVISALGSWGTESKDVLSAGMRTIIPAMQAAKITRIISLTGSGARFKADKPNLLNRLSNWSIRTVAHQVVDDGEQHIILLQKSKLAWTVIRSPLMRDASKHRTFMLSRKSPPPWSSIVRDEVASAMVELISNKEWRQAAPYIRQR
jgi:putative NADH-flavin reductase